MKLMGVFLGLLLMAGVCAGLGGCAWSGGPQVMVGGGAAVGGPAGPHSPGPPPWASAHGYRAKYSYRYYPQAYVYYSPSKGIYFYYTGGAWRAAVSLPGSIKIDLNNFVVLAMDTEEPYKYHAAVSMAYPPGWQKEPKGKNK